MNFEQIITQAWNEYDDSKSIIKIEDVSAKVSTNTVFRITFKNRGPVFAKLSYYGNFEHFKEDHIIINNLVNNIESPYNTFLARSLTKSNEVYIHRYFEKCSGAWLIFYNPIKIKERLPRRLEEIHIKQMGRELARFHKACDSVKQTLPTSSKTLLDDINSLIISTHSRQINNITQNKDFFRFQCDQFIEAIDNINYSNLPKIPVFIDWNIGNFSTTRSGHFFSRWDYDWFRVANRVIDFYFFSRVVSDVGDRTVFSYWVDTLMEDRFITFLQEYHRFYPLSEQEIRFIKESYRFFILNYVIKDGKYFFCEKYASKLQKEAINNYLPSLDKKYDVDKILKALNI